MNQIRISVVTITRNNLAGLKRTLESVFAQDLPHVESIIIDGASTDGTPQFLRSLDRKNLIWISEPDQNTSDAANKGIDRATGELVVGMTAGDTFVSATTLTQVVDLIRNEPNLTDSIIYGDYYQIIESEKILVRADHRQLHAYCSIGYEATLMGRNVARRFPCDLRLFTGNDYDIWLRCLSAKVPFIKIDLPIANFYMGGMSTAFDKQVHNVMISFFITAMNAGKIMTVRDAIGLAFRAIATQINASLRKFLGRRVIRALKDFFKMLKPHGP